MAGLGNPKTGGRKKGVTNKLTSTAKENIAAVYEKLGGAEGMATWALENHTAFYTIYSKLLPVEAKIEGAGDNGEHVFEFRWRQE